MHEHDPIHELDLVALTNRQDLLQIRGGQCGRFLGEYMLAPLCRRDNPLFSQARWKRNIDRINIVAFEQCFVSIDRVGSLALGCVSLAFAYKRLGRFHAATCHGSDYSRFRLSDCPPVFSGNRRSR